MRDRADVVVVGGGPAGLALATASAERGLRVRLVAPDHDAPWPNTYGVWTDELLPMGLSATLVRSWPATAVTTRWGTRLLARRYGLLDNTLLREGLRTRLRAAGGKEQTGSAISHRAGTVTLAGGATETGAVIVDASGHHPALLESPAPPVTAFQSAYGLTAKCSAPPATPGAMTLMDVRQTPSGDADDPTFLYAMDLGDGRWFLEETSLARTTPLPFDDLEQRLRHRVDALGITLSEEEAVEHCVFPMGAAVPPAQEVLGYGAAAGMIHPATGYQVGAALSRAPSVAEAIATALGDAGSPHPCAAAWTALWSGDRRRQRALHDVGLRCLLRFDGEDLERFFDVFFSLPEARWRAYLGDAASADDVRATMATLFARAGPLRRTLATTALGPGRAQTLEGLGLLRPRLSGSRAC